MVENNVRRRDRQIVRVLWLLKALGEGSQVSVSELARRFGTRRETIYRDLRTLEDVGYPIQGDENGRFSRPRLLDAKRAASPELRLTRDECSALVCLIRHGSMTVPLGKSLATAAAKLKAMQAIPSAERTGLDKAFSSSHAGVKQPANEEVMANLVEAILMKHRCHVTYRSPKRKTDTSYEYDPYRLRSVAGGLYCLGRIPDVGGLTTLATERILALKLTSTVFELEPDLDLGRYEREAFGVTLDEPLTVIVRVRPDQAPYVSEREWHPTQKIQQLPDGGIELTFCAGGSFEIERWILGWGDAAEVIAPESLRESVRLKSQAMSNLYRSGTQHRNLKRGRRARSSSRKNS
jgi:predicted DNA-binding transcriptional regulator YafY